MVVASTLAIFWAGDRVLTVHVREQVRRDTIARIEQLESVVKDAETGQRGFVITGDESYLEPFDQAIKRLPADLEQLVQAPGALLKPDEIAKVRQLIEQKMAELRSTLEVRRSGGFEAALPLIREGTGKRVMDDLRAEVARLNEKQNSALKADAILSDRTTRTWTQVFLLCAVLNLGILAWAYRRITESIRDRDRALHEASARSVELQQQKDLLNVTLSSIGDCVLVTDKESRITFMNPVAEEITGWKLKEAIGRPTTEVFRIVNEHTPARRSRAPSPKCSGKA